MKCLNVVSLLSLPLTAMAFYSIHYSAGADPNQPEITSDYTHVFLQPPTATHVADLYARMSGESPILLEDSIDLPTIRLFKGQNQKPAILEVKGGKLPVGLTTIVKASAFDNELRGPSLESIISTLSSHGIDVQNTKMISGAESDSIENWISAQKQPVIVLHHEAPADYHFIHRSLANSNATNSTVNGVPPLTEFQISNYQITLWTAVGLVLLVWTAIYSVAGMEVIPDSLLFAKFQSARTNKID